MTARNSAFFKFFKNVKAEVFQDSAQLNNCYQSDESKSQSNESFKSQRRCCASPTQSKKMLKKSSKQAKQNEIRKTQKDFQKMRKKLIVILRLEVSCSHI